MPSNECIKHSFPFLTWRLRTGRRKCQRTGGRKCQIILVVWTTRANLAPVVGKPWYTMPWEVYLHHRPVRWKNEEGIVNKSKWCEPQWLVIFDIYIVLVVSWSSYTILYCCTILPWTNTKRTDIGSNCPGISGTVQRIAFPFENLHIP